jgi:transcription antitermination factor NusG
MLMETERLDDTLNAMMPAPAVDACELRHFVMLTEPNKELRAEQQLRGLGFDPYVPKETKITNYGVRSGWGTAKRKREVTRPIFRGYLFLPLNRAWSFGQIYECDGLRQNGRCFYTINGQHVVLSRTDVEKLRQAERVCAEQAKPGSVYGVGQDVRLVDGPFAGFAMKIAKLDDAARIELLSDLFKGSSRLYASVDQIEPA